MDKTMFNIKLDECIKKALKQRFANSSHSSQSFQSSSRVPLAQKQDKKRKLQNDAPKPSTVKRQAIPDDVVDALKLTKVWGC